MKRLEGRVAVVTGEQRYAGSRGWLRLFLGMFVDGIYQPHPLLSGETSAGSVQAL
jgi:hypothetical protein